MKIYIDADGCPVVRNTLKIAKKYDKNDAIIVNLSGRGDKDIETVLEI